MPRAAVSRSIQRRTSVEPAGRRDRSSSTGTHRFGSSEFSPRSWACPCGTPYMRPRRTQRPRSTRRSRGRGSWRWVPCIAVCGPWLRAIAPKIGLSLQVLGTAAILVATWVYTSSTAGTEWPGSDALWPVLATVAVIAGGSMRGVDRFGWFAKWKPMQWMGNISFSLYLVHYPIIIIAEQYASTGDDAAVVLTTHVGRAVHPGRGRPVLPRREPHSAREVPPTATSPHLRGRGLCSSARPSARSTGTCTTRARWRSAAGRRPRRLWWCRANERAARGPTSHRVGGHRSVPVRGDAAR